MKNIIYGLVTLLIVVVLGFAVYKSLSGKDPYKNMVLIPGGFFVMGSDEFLAEEIKDKMVRENEIPAQKVELSGFYMDKYEVTNADYQSFLKTTGKKADLIDPINKKAPYNWSDGEFPEGQGNHPVVLTSWDDALEYCVWKEKRLPDEAEWEKACRGAEKEGHKWSFGDNFVSTMANTREQRLKGSREVGSFPGDVSPYGLLDMAGNVMEWTSDWYLPYAGTKIRDRRFGQKNKIIRGGGWLMNSQTARCANRTYDRPHKKHRAIGFRCVKDLG